MLWNKRKAKEPFRELTKEEQQDLLRPEEWIASQKHQGKEPNLSYCNLSGGIDWKGLCLEGLVLRGSKLRKANFQDADLIDVDLRDADLTDADLTDVKNLLPAQLAGACLTRAKLPDNLTTFEGLKTAEEMSKNSGKYFIGLMAACLYALLTIASTSDVGFFTDTSTATLPIINVAVSTVSFYWATPLVLLGAFIYFHMDLQRLWDTMAKLPAYFPDGKALHEKVYPWLLNGLVVARSSFLNSRTIPLMTMQNIISIFCAWWTTPIVLIFFWGRYLRRHDGQGTLYHSLLVLAAGLCSLGFYWLSKKTMRRIQTYSRRSLWSNFCNAVILLAGTACLLWVGSNGTLKRIVPTSANLADADVSTRPSGWSGQTDRGKTVDYSIVKGARLGGKNLKGAVLDNAFLVKADLTHSNLEGASFKNADMRKVNLTDADCSNAIFTRAHLEGAIFRNAQLNGVHLDSALLSWAIIPKANLREVDLFLADLSRADLGGADLSGADLSGVNLSGAHLSRVHFNKAHLNDANLSEVNLFKADLSGANLDGANL